MDSSFMAAFTEGLAARGFRVARFEFPYMAERRRSGKKRPPDRANVLLDTWRAAIAELEPDKLVIGGKSLGGRIASMIADETAVRGLVCLGYPFHPAGKPEVLRLTHLRKLKTPTLIVQGTRDALGNRDEVPGYALSPAIRLLWLEDGDHSFKPRVRSGRTEQEHLDHAVGAAAEFVKSL